MHATDYRNLRRRLRRALRKGYSLDFAIRSELARSGHNAQPIALAMLAAALRMPDEFRRDLNTRPDWIDVHRGFVQVNDVLFSVRPDHAAAPGLSSRHTRHGRSSEWTLDIRERPTNSQNFNDGGSSLASFVGLSVMLRAGGKRQNVVKWVTLVRQPESGMQA